MKKLIVTALFTILLLPAQAVRLSSAFGNHMVIQRQKPFTLWGVGKPGEKISVAFGTIILETKAAKDSSWKIRFPANEAGGPHSIQITGRNQITLTDVYFGDVWIASGQSNMELKLRQPVLNNKWEVSQANFPLIRYMDVKNRYATQPQSYFDTKGWLVCSPQTANDMSAVAYFFAREIFQKTSIPQGIIQCEWGGTPVEAWTSKKALADFPEFNTALNELPMAEKMQVNQPEFQKILKEFNESLVKNDKGFQGQWWKTESTENDPAWKPMSVPSVWEQSGLENFDGAVWFRKEVEISASLAAESDIQLRLSTIDDMDSTWVNGVKIGGIRGYDRNRNYTLPNGVLKPGKNVVAIRVIDWTGNGGLWGDKDLMAVQGKNESVSLAGLWKYRIGCSASELKPIGDDKRLQNMPTTLFNGMLHPLLPFGLKGVIWYQGESNVSKAKQYQTLFPAMITDWRTHFQQGDIPFYFVQLANYLKPDSLPKESNWAALREAQTMALRLPQTGMAVAIDVGEANDIHPRNKQDVGFRLALLALHQTYGIDLACYSPIVDKCTPNGNSMVVEFKNLYAGLKIKDKYGYAKGFCIAGADKKFHWATAVVDNNRIVLTSSKVTEPKYLRYAWANNPEDANVYNSAGLPLVPFRTDDL